MSDDEYYIPTFPDTGEAVGEGELGKWLELIEADPDIPESSKDVARGIVKVIRAQSN